MTVTKEIKDKELTLKLIGRLDTATAPALEDELKNSVDGVEALVFDFEGLEYISSAGLRILLSAQKIMNRQGKMTVRHVNDAIKEVFDITGFSDILTVE